MFRTNSFSLTYLIMPVQLIANLFCDEITIKTWKLCEPLVLRQIQIEALYVMNVAANSCSNRQYIRFASLLCWTFGIGATISTEPNQASLRRLKPDTFTNITEADAYSSQVFSSFKLNPLNAHLVVSMATKV